MSITLEEARARAAAMGHTMGGGEGRETERWWFFPVSQVGCKGIVVEKDDGTVTGLGSVGDLEDWLWAYDAGLVRGDAHVVDLIVEDFRDLAQAISILQDVGIAPNDWRAIRDVLAHLPARFERVPLWMNMRALRAIDTTIVRWRVEPSSRP